MKINGISDLLTKYKTKCAEFKWLHEKSHRFYYAISTIFGLTTLLFTTGSVIVNIVSLQFSGIIGNIISAVLLGMSLLFSGSKQFLKFEERYEKHRNSTLRFSVLHENIIRQEVLMDIYSNAGSNKSHEDINEDLKKYFSWITKEYDKLVLQSPEISDIIFLVFRKKFSKLHNESLNNVTVTVANISATMSPVITGDEGMRYELSRYMDSDYQYVM